MAGPVDWRLEQGVAQILFREPARGVNILDEATVEALEGVLDQVGQAQGVRAIVVGSAEPDVFLAGADLETVGQLSDPSQAIAMAARAQVLFGRLDRQRVPVVAAIDGVCLGGGLELALACHRRIVSQAATTRLGFPEVRLGLIPGFGGTQRLPRLIGVREATRLVLTGRELAPLQARRLGLVDDCFPREAFLERVRVYARDLVDASGRYLRRTPSRMGLVDRLLLALPPARDLFFLLARRRVRRETLGYYPAPLRALEAMREGLHRPLEEGLDLEAGLAGGLAVTPECKNLMRLHRLAERARKLGLLGSDSVPRRSVRSAGVLGAGVMGTDVALALARQGIPVRLKDLTTEMLRRALERMSRELDRDRRRGGLSAREVRTILGHVSPTTEPTGFGRADMVIEAVAEDLEVKREVLAEIEPRCSDTCVLASNTSALSISDLAETAKRPAQLVGLHFFNPLRKMPLVEVARGRATSDRTLATAVELARRLGKTPLVVTDTPGFLVNRLLMPYLMEAIMLVEAGVGVADVDRAMRRFGMPLGPLELIDQVGLDVAHHAAATLSRTWSDRLEPSRLLALMVGKGRLGRKAGLGFYRHGRGRRADGRAVRRLAREATGRRKRKTVRPGVLQERMVLPMINEAARCLEEGVVTRAGDVDMASVMGFGFPAFRGGVLRFADGLGLTDVLRRLETLHEVEGPRFAAATLLLSLARDGSGFDELDKV